jgi:hypothetical protein
MRNERTVVILWHRKMVRSGTPQREWMECPSKLSIKRFDGSTRTMRWHCVYSVVSRSSGTEGGIRHPSPFTYLNLNGSRNEVR